MNWIVCCFVIFVLGSGIIIGLSIASVHDAFMASRKEEMVLLPHLDQKEEKMFTTMTPSTYTLELTKESTWHNWIFNTPGYAKEHAEDAIKWFKRVLKIKHEILTLSYIRSELGFEPIRAEYEMCYGPDPSKPLTVKVIDNDDARNPAVTVIFSNIVDLRQYREMN